MKVLSDYGLATIEERAKLPVRKAPYWHPMKVNRALGFRRDKPDLAHWVARYRDKGGKYKRLPIGLAAGLSGDAEGLTFEAALAAAEEQFGLPEVMDKAAEASDLERRFDLLYCPWGDTYTVGHALADFAEWIKVTGSWSHFLGIRTRCNYYLLPAFGTLSADDFTREKFREFVEEFFTIPASKGGQRPNWRIGRDEVNDETIAKRKRTLNMLIGTLRSALKMAWEDGKFENDRVWRSLRFVPYVKRRRLQYLNRDEARRLLDACAPDLRDLIRGGLYTGCRAKELFKMRVGDLARDGYGIYVCPVKTYRPRFVFLSDEGMTFFLDLIKGRAENDFVFLTEGGRPWHYRYSRRLKTALARAGLSADFDFHCLRHTYASQLAQAGTPFGAIAEQLGHNGPETVMRTYAHFAPQMRESEVRARFQPLAENVDSVGRDAVEERYRKRSGRSMTDYAALLTNRNAPRTNFIKGDTEVVRTINAKTEKS